MHGKSRKYCVRFDTEFESRNKGISMLVMWSLIFENAGSNSDAKLVSNRNIHLLQSIIYVHLFRQMIDYYCWQEVLFLLLQVVTVLPKVIFTFTLLTRY